MTAGSPNWQKLYEMGKLPKDARGKISGLAQVDAAEKKIEAIKKGVCDNCREKLFGVNIENKSKEEVVKEPEVVNATGGSPIKVKCEVKGCDYVGEGRTEGIARNVLRMHGRTHKVKE